MLVVLMVSAHLVTITISKKLQFVHKFGGYKNTHYVHVLRRHKSMAHQIKVGDTFPSVNVTTWDKANGKPAPAAITELFKGKRVVLFSIPGAFTPTCTSQHCPSFVREAQKLRNAGIGEVFMTAVNDIFVLHYFEDTQKLAGHMVMLADGSADLAKALGLTKDLTAAGLGLRGARYAMVINDNKVEFIGLDESGYNNSSAESVLRHLGVAI